MERDIEWFRKCVMNQLPVQSGSRGQSISPPRGACAINGRSHSVIHCGDQVEIDLDSILAA